MPVHLGSVGLSRHSLLATTEDLRGCHNPGPPMNFRSKGRASSPSEPECTLKGFLSGHHIYHYMIYLPRCLMFRPDPTSFQTVEVGAEVADFFLRFFGGAGSVKRDEAFEDLIVGKIGEPAVDFGDGRIEFVVQLHENGYQSLFVTCFFFGSDRFVGAQFGEYVVHTRHR